jgi:TPP-dependent indolepyruvate ferredoxin oxidoreductase alpha subunit
MAREILPAHYLGDGVYVHDEGFQLVLAVNNHENKVVYLEDNVLKALVKYALQSGFVDIKDIID